MKKVISFSLWGQKEAFCQGAIENAKLMGAKLYRGWEIWFYITPSVPEVCCTALLDLGAKVILVDKQDDFSLLFDRFLPMKDPDVDIFVSRDCDSRLSDKEYQAVLLWEGSDKPFHCMRDNKHHHFPIMGGMWGAKRVSGVSHLHYHLIKKGDLSGRYNEDQLSLKVFYQKFRSSFLEHDDFSRYNGIPFPSHKSFVYGSFIGERITADNKPGPVEESF